MTQRGKPTQKRRRPDGRKGFALVLALSLLALALTVLLSITVLLRVSILESSIGKEQLEARLTARLSLDLALGALQSAAGRDRAVTARADLLDSNAPHPRWVGVWDVRGDNLRDYSATSDSTRREASTGRIRSPATWLVSSSPQEPRPTPAAPLDDGVALEFDAASGQDISVPPVSLPAGGACAWWVDDEGVKANLAATANYTELGENWDTGPGDRLLPHLPLYGAQRSAASRIDGWNTLETVEAAALDRLPSLDSLPFASDLDTASVDRRKGDATVLSLGVLADTARGGLRKDLSRGLEDQWHRLLHYVDSEISPDGAGPTTTNSGVDTRMAEGYVPPGGSPQPAAPRIDYEASGDAEGNPIDWPLPQPLFWENASGNRITGPSWDLLYDFYHLHKPFAPYAPIIDIGSWDSTSGVFQGYGSGRPPEMQGDNRWWTVYGNSVGIGVGRPAGIDDPRALFPEAQLRAGGPAYERLFVPGGDDQAYAAEDFFRMDPFPETDRREPLWNSLNPIQVKTQLTLGLRSFLATSPGDPEHPGYRLRLYFFPSVVLWNPYNVRLTTRELEIKMDFKDLRWQIFVDEDFDGFDAGDIYFDNGGGAQTSPSTGSADPVNEGVYFGFSLSASFYNTWTMTRGERFSFVARSVTLEPGEVRVLTLPTARSLHASHIDGRSTSNPDDFFLTPEYNADHYAYVDLGHTPRYGGIPQGADRDSWRAPVDFPSGGPVQVRLFPRSEGDADPRDNQMLFETNQNIFINNKQPILLQRSLVDFFDTVQTIDLNRDIDVGLRSGITKFASLGFQLLPTDNSPGELLLDSNPRASNTVDFSGTAEGHSPLFEAAFTAMPSAGTTDIQIKPGTTGRSYFGPAFSPPRGESEIIAYSVPRQPIQSIGDFMHANLSLFPDLPNYALGGSIKPDAVPGGDYYGVTGEGILVPDLSFSLNDALLDRFFFSTVPPDWDNLPSVYDAYDLGDLKDNIPPYTELDAAALADGLRLPNARMSYRTLEDEDPEAYLRRLRDFDTAAGALLVEGAFNINSTSTEAWKAILAGLSPDPESPDLAVGLAADGGSSNLSPGELRNNLSRFGEPMGLPGEAWRGPRRLSDAELEDLARAIVDEIRSRGPFASLSDFVNRRLVSGSAGEQGALQAAIEASGINAGIPASQAGRSDYLTQNDIVRALAPVISARSDTFRVRFMGESKGGSRAYGEAIVQRLPEFVDPADSPEVGLDELSSDANRSFGRRFVILSFNWITPPENET